VSSAADPAAQLAQRLRELRESRWPGRTITQAQLAEALNLSVPSISSWENQARPTVPPLRRLREYSTFFATERSIAKEPYLLSELAELTMAERANRSRLLAELTALRDAATSGVSTPAGDSLLRFPPGENIVIVCAPLPAEMRHKMPYPDSADPDYVDLYNYADIDALMELYGRLCALNPDSTIRRVLADDLTPDDYTYHLILLGGVDWNSAVRDLAQRTMSLPVRQSTRVNEEDLGWFEVAGRPDSGAEARRFEPKLVRGIDGSRQLVEDVAHLYFGPSPYYQKRTVMSFNGMYTRGTYGAVRALTHARFRERNEEYLRQRFANCPEWSLLTKVVIVEGQAVTPDWTVPEARLHEWPAIGTPGG
jgi:transcriptional regulator with XRE-family HTH domain